jgi:hypothetical protein
MILNGSSLYRYRRCVLRLRCHEKTEDYKSHHSDPNVYVFSLPMLKTAANLIQGISLLNLRWNLKNIFLSDAHWCSSKELRVLIK